MGATPIQSAEPASGRRLFRADNTCTGRQEPEESHRIACARAIGAEAFSLIARVRVCEDPALFNGITGHEAANC